MNVEENHGTMSTTRLSVSNLVSLAFSLSPRSFFDATGCPLLPIIMSRQVATIIPFSPHRPPSERLFKQSRDFPSHPVLLGCFYLRYHIAVQIYDPRKEVYLPLFIHRPKNSEHNEVYYL